LTGCNLRCKYCDTGYAYQEGRYLKINAILKKIKEYPCKNVEVTGGEPLIQKETPLLLAELVKRKYNVLVETNGSISLEAIPEDVIKIVDIKTPGSREEDSFLMENLKYINSRDNIKFVISHRQDFEWSRDFCIRHELFEKADILFSSVEQSLDYQSLCKWILDENLNVRFQPQLHKLIWKHINQGV
jgi:7-carboxy-7-deazaguanine synthase